MMFVTANDSAWVEHKRSANGFELNEAEEWPREVVVVVVTLVKAREVEVD